jgi:hypothetical protein
MKDAGFAHLTRPVELEQLTAYLLGVRPPS